MSKPILGLVLGGILGVLDGFSTLFADDPEVRVRIIEIVIGSTIKGLVAGYAIGYFSWRFKSLPLGIAIGLGIGLFLALLVAFWEGGHYVEIILPGGIMGLIVGFATQRYGTGLGAGPEHGRT